MPPAMITAVDVASPAAAPHRAGQSRALPLVFGLAVGGLTMAAFLGGALVRAVGSSAVPVTSITALLLLATTPLLRRMARWAGSPRPERAAAWSLLGAAPALFLAARFAIGNYPVLVSHWRCGSGDIGFMILSPLPFALFGALSGLLAFAVTASRPRLRLAAALGFAARGALILAGILVAAATFRALYHQNTDGAIRYVESLPTACVLAPMNRATAKVTLLTRESAPSREQLEDETRFGDMAAERVCSEGSCSVTLRRTGSEFRHARPVEGNQTTRIDESVVVQRDEKHGFWIVGGKSVLRDREFALVDLNIQDIGDELSAPTGWILGGAAGVGIALVLWLKRRRLAQRLLRIEAAREAQLGDNGWVTFHDDSPAWRASPDLALAPGAVVLIGRGVGGGSATGAYRSEGAQNGEEIVAGAREDLAAALRHRLSDLDALSLVTVAITASPLLAAWSARLVF